MARSRLISGGKLKTFFFYLLMMAAAIGVFFIIRHYGKPLMAPVASDAATRAGVHGPINTLLHVLLSLAVVIITARPIGSLFKLFHQPPVIGEVIAGIMLGSSFLGAISPHV